mgnify:CR=1 FL=1
MTQAKAQTVASALIGLGYTVRVYQDLDVSIWVVEATGSDILASAVSTFATNQAVVGTVNQAKFV